MHIHDLVTTVFLAANIIQIDGDALDLGNVSRLNTTKRFSGYERLPTAETNAASPVFEDWVTKYGVDSLYPGSIMMTMNIP
uniref:Uncharacterized protein n=1 Tax=Hyaloperonospora arabidopsidis (strain Emoy2) TaxID=559515 RepID=M4B4S3_HYAAE